MESAHPLQSPVQSDNSFSSTLPSLALTSAPKHTLPNMPPCTIAVDYGLYTHGCAPIPAAGPPYPYLSFPIKSEFPDQYIKNSSPDPVTRFTYGKQTESPPAPPAGLLVPALVLELVHCEQDELQVRSKISAHLTHLQEEDNSQATKAKPLTAFGLMCHIADQTLFSIVEWARSCTFFKELKVREEPYGREH